MPRGPLDPIHALLDVTQLGVVQEAIGDTVHRAGIHRVVEQLVRSLRATPGVTVTLCSPERSYDTVDFLEQHREFRALPFRPARKRFGARLRARVVARHSRAGAHPPGALPLRVLNKLVFVTNQALDAAPWSTLPDADVFHSPVYALPAPGDRVRRMRYFLTIHDVIPFLRPEFSSWGGDAWLRRILGSLQPDDHVVTVSEHTRHDLLNTWPGITPERVRVTRLAADAERFYHCDDAERIAAVRAKYGVPDGRYVLSVSTLEPRKNIPHLIKSFAALARAERVDDLSLVLTGSKGWDYDAIFSEVGRFAELRDRIVFTGYVDDEDMAALYTGALVFVYPSHYEGFGLPLLEAMQCGTPVITSNTSSMPEVVGDAGVLVDPGDGDALAQAMLDVYRDPARRAELAALARARAREFTWDRFAAETVAAYRAAL